MSLNKQYFPINENFERTLFHLIRNVLYAWESQMFIHVNLLIGKMRVERISNTQTHIFKFNRDFGSNPSTHKL